MVTYLCSFNIIVLHFCCCSHNESRVASVMPKMRFFLSKLLMLVFVACYILNSSDKKMFAMTIHAFFCATQI